MLTKAPSLISARGSRVDPILEERLEIDSKSTSAKTKCSPLTTSPGNKRGDVGYVRKGAGA